MEIIYQQTIARPCSFSGIGLHAGKKVAVTFKPADVDRGINFVRIDIPSKPTIPVAVDNLITFGPISRRTSLRYEGAEVHTIEHLMAVLAGLGIDNLTVELDGIELPGMDGSGKFFADKILEAGIQKQTKPRQFFTVKEPVFVEEAGASIVVLPAQDLVISYTLSYNHPLLRAQFLELVINEDNFKKELCLARTFCLEQEARQLQEKGLGGGANYENTLVVGNDGVIKNTLRYEDEFVRHKILDLLGDLYILGQPLRGHVIALKSGHSLNLKLIKKLQQQKQRAIASGVSTVYTGPVGNQLDSEMIMKILPHRYPFLLVDRIIFLEEGRRAVGIKNVTINDYFFQGHFPKRPVMPGVLIVEAMAQVGGVMMLAPQENRGKLAFFLAANNIKFRKTVLPGDQLVLEVEAGRIKSKTGQVFAKAIVDGNTVAEAELMFALVED